MSNVSLIYSSNVYKDVLDLLSLIMSVLIKQGHKYAADGSNSVHLSTGLFSYKLAPKSVQ